MEHIEYLDRKSEWLDRGELSLTLAFLLLMVTFVICMYEMKVYDPNIFAEGVFFVVLCMSSLMAFLLVCLGFHR